MDRPTLRRRVVSARSRSRKAGAAGTFWGVNNRSRSSTFIDSLFGAEDFTECGAGTGQHRFDSFFGIVSLNGNLGNALLIHVFRPQHILVMGGQGCERCGDALAKFAVIS